MYAEYRGEEIKGVSNLRELKERTALITIAHQGFVYVECKLRIVDRMYYSIREGTDVLVRLLLADGTGEINAFLIGVDPSNWIEIYRGQEVQAAWDLQRARTSLYDTISCYDDIEMLISQPSVGREIMLIGTENEKIDMIEAPSWVRGKYPSPSYAIKKLDLGARYET